ncbi:MAG: hypothetical protein CBR30_07430 [Dictyoglomus sp. NZ13-RE01]|nr:MAG: hypothetical protein CBR30_07430 [Dictyoglomus sp. NZ13-RE01]
MKFILIIFIFCLIFTSYSYAFEFAVIGDSEGYDGIPSITALLLNKIYSTSANFIIHLGDFINSWEGNELELVKKQFSSSPIPIYFVPGNNDISKDGGKNFKDFTGRPLYYYFDFENARFIILNNALGRLGEEQINWLKEVLSSSGDKVKFVFMHRPLVLPPILEFFRRFYPYLGHDLKETKILMDLFEREKVKYVFSGHIHLYFRKRVGNVTYIISGSGGSIPHTSIYEAGNPHFILIEVNDKIIDKKITLDDL